jgi:hypothetical protein
MFFPKLVDKDRPSLHLTGEELEKLYNDAVRPVAEQLFPEAIHDWPASFQAAQFRDRKDTTGFSNSAILIPKDRADRFGNLLKDRINSTEHLKWARLFFWGTEIRGVKDTSCHPMDAHPDEKARMLGHVTRLVNTNMAGTWYVDVGLEFILRDRALLWSTHAHSNILVEALGIERRDADAIVNNHRRYSQDISTHLTTLSGFRAELKEESDSSPAYIQVYTTDKTQTYNPQNGKYGKTLTPKVALQNPPSWCQSLLNLYHDAALKTDVVARIEVRCPLAFVEDCLVSFRREVIYDSLICYRREIWWSVTSVVCSPCH